jgi:hypothetical protein
MKNPAAGTAGLPLFESFFCVIPAPEAGALSERSASGILKEPFVLHGYSDS